MTFRACPSIQELECSFGERCIDRRLQRLGSLVAALGQVLILSLPPDRLNGGSPAVCGIAHRVDAGGIRCVPLIGPRPPCRPRSIPCTGPASIQQHPSAQQIELGPPVSLPFDQLDPVDMTLNRTGRPGQAETGLHCGSVRQYAVGEPHEAGQVARLSIEEPWAKSPCVALGDYLPKPLHEGVASSELGILSKELVQQHPLPRLQLFRWAQAYPSHRQPSGLPAPLLWQPRWSPGVDGPD